MQQQVVLITGGSSGIGKSIGHHLQSKGLKVYGTSRDISKHSDFKAFQLLQLEVSDPNSVRSAVEAVIEREGRLDVLVNNAGVGITGPIEETPHEEIRKAFDINFHGPIHVAKAVLPQMRLQKSGLIINITSIAGYMGLPYRGVYSATKSALIMVTEALRLEVKDFGIDVVTLAPGDFATNIASGRYHAAIDSESPYHEIYERTLTMIDKDVNTAEDPASVARKVLEIIRRRNPNVHYKVGSWLQKFSVVLKGILPNKIYEKLLLKHYKL